MPERRRVVCLKIRKLLQKSGNLSNYSEKIIGCRVIMHLKALNGFVILYYRVKRSFLQLLPVLAKVIFRVRIKQQKKTFNVRDNLFQSKIVSSCIQMECLLLQFSDRVRCFLERISYFFTQFSVMKFIFVVDCLFKAIILDHPKIFKIHQKRSEKSNKEFQFLLRYSSY